MIEVLTRYHVDTYSGGFRNLERGFGQWHAKRTQKFWVATPTSGHINAFMTHVIIVVAITSELFKIAGSSN